MYKRQILFHSTEIPELVHLSDRMIVLYEGRVAARLDADEADERTIMNAALGGAHSPLAAGVGEAA